MTQGAQGDCDGASRWRNRDAYGFELVHDARNVRVDLDVHAIRFAVLGAEAHRSTKLDKVLLQEQRVQFRKESSDALLMERLLSERWRSAQKPALRTRCESNTCARGWQRTVHGSLL